MNSFRAKARVASKWAYFSLFFSILLIVALFGKQALAAFEEPTNQPPEDNVFGFIRIDKDNQAKKGALRLGTDDIIGPYNYQLEVRGDGALLNEAVVDNNFKTRSTTATSCAVDAQCSSNQYCNLGYCHQDILFVDSGANRVCIGPCLNVGAKLEVNTGGAQINGGQQLGLSAVSINNQAIYGEGGSYGIYGVAQGSSGSSMSAGVKGVALDNAVRGYAPNTQNQVYGYSISGFGVYGYNTNTIGLWSGYFNGRLESSLDVSGAKFLTTHPRFSYVPFTSGQSVAEFRSDRGYDYAVNFKPLVFDGTYMWGASGSVLYKVRAQDGFKAFSLDLGGTPTSAIYDNNYLWVTVAYDDSTPDRVAKVNLYSGSEESCSFSVSADYDPQSIVFDGAYYWVANKNGRIVKMSSACSNNGEVNIGYSISKMIFDGTYFWVVSADDNCILKVNPQDTGSNVVMYHSDFQNPQDILFDNSYYWVIDYNNDAVTKFYLDSDGNPFAFGTYPVTQGPKYITFDGTYVWVAGISESIPGQTILTRLLAADPRQSGICNAGACDVTGNSCSADADCVSDHRVDFTMSAVPLGLGFDGNSIWFGTAGNVVTKYFTGTGWGLTDLSGTLTLQHNNPLWQQTGSISVADSGRIGGDAQVSGDITVNGNVWGQSTAADTIPVIPGGTANCSGVANCYNCPEGHYIRNITTNGSGVVTQIDCRPL